MCDVSIVTDEPTGLALAATQYVKAESYNIGMKEIPSASANDGP
jgi:hypothetical protein